MITLVSEENRHSLQAQLVPKCCPMRNLDRNQPAAGSSSISEKYQGAENALSAVRLLQSRDQRNLTCVPNWFAIRAKCSRWCDLYVISFCQTLSSKIEQMNSR